jgi:hypothetical protein
MNRETEERNKREAAHLQAERGQGRDQKEKRESKRGRESGRVEEESKIWKRNLL